MDQNKLGEMIKNIRIKNNLTQQKLGDMLGVTYQAVSKWENGKNIPDIAILKLISEKFDVDFEELLTGNKKNKKELKLIYFIIPILIVSLLFTLFLISKDKNSYEFQNLKSNDPNFEIQGVVAFSDDKTSIFISNIEAKFQDDTKYNKLDCTLYEVNGKSHTQISKCDASSKNEKEDVSTLSELLKTTSFNVGNFSRTCKYFMHNNLYLEINAIDSNNKTTSYKVPIIIEENCEKN